MYKEIEGDLIALAKQGKFDIIVQGCNCFCRQKSGVAKQMVEAFSTNNPVLFTMEDDKYYGDISKLGNINYNYVVPAIHGPNKYLRAVNAYTQFKIKKFNDYNYEYTTEVDPFDYDAFTMCMKKINHVFKGLEVGMPMIGSHLAGGHWPTIKAIIQNHAPDCNITVVVYKP